MHFNNVLYKNIYFFTNIYYVEILIKALESFQRLYHLKYLKYIFKNHVPIFLIQLLSQFTILSPRFQIIPSTHPYQSLLLPQSLQRISNHHRFDFVPISTVGCFQSSQCIFLSVKFFVERLYILE